MVPRNVGLWNEQNTNCVRERAKKILRRKGDKPISLLTTTMINRHP